MPAHAAVSIGESLPSDYFSPGCSRNKVTGEIYYSKWAIAYWNGASFLYRRSNHNAPWTRVQ